MADDVVELRNQAFLRVDKLFHTGFLAASFATLLAQIANTTPGLLGEVALVSLCVSMPLLAGYLLASSTDEFAVRRPARKLREATSQAAVATSIVGIVATVATASVVAAGALGAAGIVAWVLSIIIAKANFGERWNPANDPPSSLAATDEAT